MQSVNNLSGLADEVRSMERRHNEEVVQLKMRLGRVLLDLKSKNMLEFRVAVRENGLLMNTFDEIIQIARMNPPQECHWLGYENLLKIADALPKGKNIAAFAKPFETESPDDATKAVILKHILKSNGVNGISDNAITSFAKAGVASKLTKANIDRIKLSKNQTKTLQSIFTTQTQGGASSKKTVLNPRLQQNIEKMNCDVRSSLAEDVDTKFIDISGLNELVVSLELLMNKVQMENNGDYKLGSDVEKDELEKLIDELLKEEK